MCRFDYYSLQQSQPFQITLWGSEAGLDNGMAEGEEFIWLATDVNGNPLDLDVSYINGTSGVYSLNSITFVGALDISSPAPADVPGCTDETALNYNSDANVDDGSCEFPEPAAGTAIADCGDFAAGPNATWTHVLTATLASDGASSQGAQSFTMNITSLPEGESYL